MLFKGGWNEAVKYLTQIKSKFRERIHHLVSAPRSCCAVLGNVVFLPFYVSGSVLSECSWVTLASFLTFEEVFCNGGS